MNRADRAEILDRRYHGKRNRTGREKEKGETRRKRQEEVCDERRIFHRSVRGGFGNGTRESWTSWLGCEIRWNRCDIGPDTMMSK